MKKCRGDVFLVRFPFTDLSSSKVRPALVISSFKEDYIIVGIFSKKPSRELFETWIMIEDNSKDFPTTGLKKNSVLKAEKIALVHQKVIQKKLGEFSNQQMEKVEKALKKALQFKPE